MADRLTHRLTWNAWLAHLDALSRACSGASRRDAPEMVRELNSLIARAPSLTCHEGMVALDAVRLESLLDLGMADGAMLAMLDKDAGFIASRGRGDNYFVTIILPGHGREEAAFGASLALAGVRAVIMSLCAPALAVNDALMANAKLPAALH